MRRNAEFEKPLNGFTLIELLIVIAIMALVIGFSIPAFTGMGEGTKIDGAARNLKQACALARQWAVTHRQNVYLLLPNDQATGNSTNFQYRAYAVFAQKESTVPDAGETFNTTNGADGELIQGWTYLPKGVGFWFQEVTTKYNFRIDGITYDKIACIIWKPDGTIDNKSTSSNRTISIYPGVEVWKGTDTEPAFGTDLFDKGVTVRNNQLTGLTQIKYNEELE
jgi:prepilin-type N-terminal cleavage/methylation domain-containing protein